MLLSVSAIPALSLWAGTRTVTLGRISISVSGRLFEGQLPTMHSIAKMVTGIMRTVVSSVATHSIAVEIIVFPPFYFWQAETFTFTYNTRTQIMLDAGI
jgi:hypothetical protein